MGDQVDPERWRTRRVYGNFSSYPSTPPRRTVSKVIWVSEEYPEGRLVALKWIQINSEKTKKRFIREFQVWADANEQSSGHPNIVPFLGIYVEPEIAPGNKERRRMFISPWYEDDHAQTFLGEPRNRHTSGNFCPADRLHLIIDVAKGLRHMHNVGLVHADLNPTNILIESVNNEVTSSSRIRFRALISDFNQSRYSDRPGLTTSGDHESGAYSSPEFGRPIEEEDDEQDTQTSIDRGSQPGDVWSFGATAHFLITTTGPCRCQEWGTDNSHDDYQCGSHKSDWKISMRHMNRYPGILPLPLYRPLYDQLWGLFMDKCWKWSRTDRATMDIIVAGLESIEQRLNISRCICPHNPNGGVVTQG